MDLAAFADRDVQPEDVPFICDSFQRSYLAVGHVAGIRDVFKPLVMQPFRDLLAASEPETPAALVCTRVVFPVAEPTEIAGYAVYSPRHNCLVYLLTKPPYARHGVAAHLLCRLKPKFARCFSTAQFASMSKHLELESLYSPFMLNRMRAELQEGFDV